MFLPAISCLNTWVSRCCTRLILTSCKIKATDPLRQEAAEASSEQPSALPAFQELQFDDPKQAFQVLQSLLLPFSQCLSGLFCPGLRCGACRNSSHTYFCAQAKSTAQLLQSLAVFKACTIKPLVQNADTLLTASRRIAAPVVDHAVKHTFFRHFCGGECVDSIQPTLQASLPTFPLASQGGILRYTVMPEREEHPTGPHSTM